MISEVLGGRLPLCWSGITREEASSIADAVSRDFVMCVSRGGASGMDSLVGITWLLRLLVAITVCAGEGWRSGICDAWRSTGVGGAWSVGLRVWVVSSVGGIRSTVEMVKLCSIVFLVGGICWSKGWELIWVLVPLLDCKDGMCSLDLCQHSKTNCVVD